MTEQPPPSSEGATSLDNSQGADSLTGLPTVGTGRRERERQLERLWLLTAKALADGLEDPEKETAKAATLNVARQFLSDNKVTNESLDRIGEGKHEALAKVLDQLPNAEGDAEPLRPLYGDSLPTLPDP